LNYSVKAAVFKYGFAISLVAVASVFRYLMHPLLEEGGVFLQLAAIIIVAWVGGLGPCLVAQVLTLVITSNFFDNSDKNDPETPLRVIVVLGGYFFVGIAVALLSGSVRKAQRRAQETEQSLRDADRRKDEFLALLAHELRNPLAPIGNGLQILGIAGDDAPLREETRVMMERQFEHLVRLVDDLLDVSRIARGKIELRTERITADAALDRAVEAVRPLIDGQGHRLTIRRPNEPLWLRADPVRLTQVITNLLTNAARYTDRGGEITLFARSEPGWVVIGVRDNGIGIPAEFLPRVFDMFLQAEQGLQRGGLGLGLTIVKSLVKMHGGTVEAHSEGKGKGSEFVFRLPALADAAETGVAPAMSDEDDRQCRRILVVDDNVDAADSLAHLLQLKRHDVRVAHSGQEALDTVEHFQPEIAILDLGMPGMDGYSLAQQLQAMAKQPVTLVALTGWGTVIDRQRTEAAGFARHLVKPISREDVAAICEGA
jgi:signal transduction histidine kinase